MGNIIIIIDTNIFVGKKPPKLKTLLETIKQYSESGDVFITETVLDELTNHYYHLLSETLLPSLSNYSFVYKTMELNYKVTNLVTKDVFQQIKDSLKKFFENNVIPLDLDTIKIADIYERALMNRPPFTSFEADGDSGFKDTLIWLSILNHTYDDYSEVVFMTRDTDFFNNRTKFQEVFYKKHEKPLTIYREPFVKNKENKVEKNLDITVKTETKESKKIKDFSEDSNVEELLEDYEKMRVFREKLDNVLYNILLFSVDPFEDYTSIPSMIYYDNQNAHRFRLLKHLAIADFESFKNHLIKLIFKSGMSIGIHATKLFKPYLDPIDIIEKYRINMDSVKDLLKIMIEIEKELPNYTEAFLTLLNEEINLVAYDEIDIDPNDLPF